MVLGVLTARLDHLLDRPPLLDGGGFLLYNDLIQNKSMTEFLQASNLITENGEVVDQQESPIIQTKKLNGQGTIYKLTDANIESINAQKERGGVINVNNFIRSVRSHFNPGHYDVSGITHTNLPDFMKDLGLIRVEVNGKVDITDSHYCWGEDIDYSIYIYMMEGALLSLDSWYGFAKKAHEDNEVGDDYLEICDMLMEQIPQQVSHFFDDTMFHDHLDAYDKISIVKDRVYEAL